jgi:catechol-2,3-dioxygenase
MHLVERTGKGYAFLTNSQAHHVIELQLSDRNTVPQDEFICRIQSIKFESPDKVSFAEAYRNLNEGDVEGSTLDKIICWSMTFHDPNGNVIELILDTLQLPGRSNYWEGRELPLDESQILSE